MLTLCDSTKCCYHNFFELEQRIRLAIRKKSRKDTINYYEVTITTLPEETAIDAVTKLKKFLTSKQFKPTRSWTACVEHERTNAHIHIYCETDGYINIRDLKNMMKSRCSLTKLKTSLDRIKWRNYVVKQQDAKTIFEDLEQVHNYIKTPKYLDLDFN